MGYGEPGCWVAPSGEENGAGIFEHSMEAGNRVGIGLSYRPARLHSLAELVHGLLKSLKIWAQVGGKMVFWNGIELAMSNKYVNF